MLVARGLFRGAVILGVFAATVLGLIFGVPETPDKVVDALAMDDSSIIGDSLGYLDDVPTVSLIPVIFALFMTDFFDTVGTAVAVGRGGGMLDDEGSAPERRPAPARPARGRRRRRDGVRAPLTLRRERAGVAEGAWAGLASVVTAGLFVLAIFFVPIISLVGQDVVVGENTVLHRGRARAGDGRLPDDPDRRGHRLVGAESSIPAFLIIAGIPLIASIAAGIGLGVIGYVVAMAATGKAREIHPLMWAIAPFFLAFFAADWLEVNVF